MLFEAHGQFRFDVQGNLLLIEAYGPFNREAALAFEQGVKQAVLVHLAGVEWAMLASLHGDSIYTPDSLPILKELHLWRIAHGMRRVAVVHGQVDARASASVTQMQYNQVYAADQAALCAQRYFDQHEEALHWLALEGFTASSAEWARINPR